ncbi:MAG: hypothetical protein Q7K28_03385, partial [Candidatus Wildermuthbacteria bacterium]|nr:hypothetical protein [Candidatus Wildermuthbacteria bacterium]
MEGEEIQKFIPLSEAAKGTPYSQEYLSLLARQGKVFARKINNVWHTTRKTIGDYTSQQRTNLLSLKRVNFFLETKEEKPDIRSSGHAPGHSTGLKFDKNYWKRKLVFSSRLAIFSLAFLLVSSASLAFVKNPDLKNDAVHLGYSLLGMGQPYLEAGKIFFENFGLDTFEELAGYRDLTMGGFSTGQNFIIAQISPYKNLGATPLSFFRSLLSRFRHEPELASLQEQLDTLREELDKAQLSIVGNERAALSQKSQEKKPASVPSQGSTFLKIQGRTLDETIPSLLPSLLLTLEQRVNDLESSLSSRFSSLDSRFTSYPTILIPPTTATKAGITILNPATLTSETVNVSSALNVTGSATVTNDLTVSGESRFASSSFSSLSVS